MKVLYVAKKIPRPDVYKISNNLLRMRGMPCTLLHARSHQEAVRFVPEADAICLSTFSTNRWVPGNSPIYKASVPVARFYLDVWKIPDLKKFPPGYRNSHGTLISDFFRKYDIHISVCKELLTRHCPEWIDSMFWSPHCIDVQDYNVEKDIDVLFWGRADGAGGYKTRAKVRALLEHYIVPGSCKIRRELRVCTMSLGKQNYRCVIVDPGSKLYYGPKLHKLISRTKVCCTAPPDCAAPVGKYFENAACGTVSLTTDFTDRGELGFEHGKHLWVAGLNRYMRSLDRLLKRPKLIKEMSKNAKELIRTRHTPAVRGKELYEFLRGETGVT